MTSVLQNVALALLCCSFVLVASAPARVLAGRPNFLLVHLDDVGYGDFSFYSQTVSKDLFRGKASLTPQIDALARGGVAFSSYYSSACVCTPSRAGILTGRYPIRTTMFPGVVGPSENKGLPLEEITIARWLKEKANYRTFMVGKWHLGHYAPFLPTFHGFDRWTGMPYSHDYCACPSSLTNTKDNVCRTWDPPCPIMNGTMIIQQPAILNDIMDLYVDMFKEYMDEALDMKKPFFAYYGCQHTHHPQFAKLENVGISAKNGGRPDAYGDAVLEMDDAVGRMVEHIRSRNIAENTYVFITSDNGGANIYGALSGSNSPLRCGKGTTWEGGQRVPLIVWGGKTMHGRILDDIVAGMDIFPTISTLAGVNLNSYPRTLDGIDFSKLVLGQASKGIRDSFAYYSLEGNLDAVRVGNYKVHFGTSLWVNEKTRDCHPAGIRVGRQSQPLVYDLAKDPSESSHLPLGHPAREDSIRKARMAMHTINCTLSSIKTGHCEASTTMHCYAKPGDRAAAQWPPVPFRPWSQSPRACCSSGYDVILPDFMDTTRYSCKKISPVSLTCHGEDSVPCNPSQDIFPQCQGKTICTKKSDDGSGELLRQCGKASVDSNGMLCSEGWTIERCPVGMAQCRKRALNGNVMCTRVPKKCDAAEGVAYFGRPCGSCPTHATTFAPAIAEDTIDLQNHIQSVDFTDSPTSSRRDPETGGGGIPPNVDEHDPPGAVHTPMDSPGEPPATTSKTTEDKTAFFGLAMLLVTFVFLVTGLVFVCVRRYYARLDPRAHIKYEKQSQTVDGMECH